MTVWPTNDSPTISGIQRWSYLSSLEVELA